MRVFATIACVVAAGFGSGCGGDESSIPEEGTIFEYSRSGGLAFSVYEVSIDADGGGTAEYGSDLENLEVKQFELSSEEVDELRSILEETPISSLPDPGEAVCADCFEYTYSWGGDEYTTSDAGEPVPELDELGAFLAGLPLPEDTPNGG